MKILDQQNPVEIVLAQARYDVAAGKITEAEYSTMEREFKERQTINPPKIAIIGKAGVGKSTTINNLFSVSEFITDVINLDTPDGTDGMNLVSDISTGSVKAIRKRFNLISGACIDIIDMPGLGDDIETDKQHEKIYRQILPNCDVILYVMDASDRTFAEDQRILRDVVKTNCEDISKKLVIAINKVDTIGEKDGILWDIRINLPTRGQKKLIDTKLHDVQKKFSSAFGISKEQIVCYSGLKRYNLKSLLLALTIVNPFIDSSGDKPFEELIPQKYREMWERAKVILEQPE